MKRKIESLTLIILSMLFLLALNNIPESSGNLKLSMAPDKKSYLAGEPVQVTFRLKNTGKEILTINNLKDEDGAAQLFSLTVYKDDGERIPALSRGYMRQLPTDEEMAAIAGGEVWERTIPLAGLYPPLEPGDYQVTGIYRNAKYNQNVDTKLWVGEIADRPARITINPLDQDALDQYLQTLTRSQDPAEQLKALQMLALHHDTRAIPVLKQIAMRSSNPNSSAAIEALGEIGPEAVGTLAFLMGNMNKGHWPEIIYAFGKTRDPKALEYLVPLLLTKQEENISAWSLKAIANIKDQQVPDLLIQKLKDSRETIRQIAAESLGRAKDAAAVPVLRELLEQEFRANVRRQVAKSLYLLTGEIYAYKDFQGKMTPFNPDKDLTQEEKDTLNEYAIKYRRPVKTESEE